jgi:predicted NACHT family NTPase
MELINYIENKLPDSYNVDIVNKNQCEIVKNGHELISTGGFDKVNISKKEAIIEVINKFLDKYNDIEKNK